MAGGAWPFLVGRSKNAGYRVVVAPGLMKGRPRDDVERIGWLSTSDVTGPAEAIATELSGLAAGPVTAVFRNFLAREEDFLPAGRGPLTDSAGRPIILTEGFILELSKERAADLSITTEDMDRTRELIAPAFREFWHYNDDDYPQHYSCPFCVGGNASKGILLALRSPRGASDRTSSPPSIRSNGVPPESGAGAIIKVERQAKFTHSGGKPPNWRVIFAVIAAAGSISLAGLGIASLIPRPSPPDATALGSGRSSAPHVPVSPEKRLLTGFCHALDAGDIHAAYALTTPAFRAAVSEKAFAADLLGGYTKAESCVTGESTIRSGADTATLKIIKETGKTSHRTSNSAHKWNVMVISYQGKLLIARIRREK